VSVTVIHARHILVPTETEARAIMERLDAGEDFGQLAAEYSQDPNTRDSGGDLGWFVRSDLTVPELADFAQQLQPGQRGGPFATSLGYHVVETLEITQRPATPEEQYNAGVLQFNNWLDLMRGNAIIERYIN
jgi:parvulin-like peptidyl-prolyl isomerase